MHPNRIRLAVSPHHSVSGYLIGARAGGGNDAGGGPSAVETTLTDNAAAPIDAAGLYELIAPNVDEMPQAAQNKRRKVGGG